MIIGKAVIPGKGGTATSASMPIVSATISFYIGENEYHADPGMTWTQWVNSGYNTANYYISSNYVKPSGGSYYVVNVSPSDTIIANQTYQLQAGQGTVIQ